MYVWYSTLYRHVLALFIAVQGVTDLTILSRNPNLQFNSNDLSQTIGAGSDYHFCLAGLSKFTNSVRMG